MTKLKFMVSINSDGSTHGADAPIKFKAFDGVVAGVDKYKIQRSSAMNQSKNFGDTSVLSDDIVSKEVLVHHISVLSDNNNEMQVRIFHDKLSIEEDHEVTLLFATQPRGEMFVGFVNHTTDEQYAFLNCDIFESMNYPSYAKYAKQRSGGVGFLIAMMGMMLVPAPLPTFIAPYTMHIAASLFFIGAFYTSHIQKKRFIEAEEFVVRKFKEYSDSIKNELTAIRNS